MMIVAPDGRRFKAQLQSTAFDRKILFPQSRGGEHDVLNATSTEIVFLEAEAKS
jgi:hypothetical protein